MLAVFPAYGASAPLLIGESSESDAEPSSEAGTLSAGETPEADASRPGWVDTEPNLVGDVYRMSMVVGPFTTCKECDDHLPEALQKAAGQYIEDYLGHEAAGRVRLPARLLLERVVKDRWEETRSYSVGPMKNLHVLLEFDRKFNEEAKEAWRKVRIEDRIGGVAGMGVLILGSLAALFGLLKVTARKKNRT